MEESQPSEPISTPTTGTTLTLLHAIRMFRTAGKALCAQIGLHGQLARVEWTEEKNRLLMMLTFTLLGFTCLLCGMLFAGVLVLALSWETTYRITAVLALITVYGMGAGIAWHNFHTLSARGVTAFAASREELAADIAMIKSYL